MIIFGDAHLGVGWWKQRDMVRAGCAPVLVMAVMP